MGNIPVLKPQQVIRLLENLGFVEVRQRGSHKQFRHEDGHRRTFKRRSRIMSSQPENKQTALENITAGGDINATISQEIHHEPNKLAEKIGIAVSGGVVNVENLIIADRPNDLQSEKFTHDQSFYNNLGDREIDHQGNF